MSYEQAKNIARFSCFRKKPRALADAVTVSEELGITYYACPFSLDEYHYHITSGRNGRSPSALRRAAERLGRLGPKREG